jgi:hypothetical protein
VSRASASNGVLVDEVQQPLDASQIVSTVTMSVTAGAAILERTVTVCVSDCNSHDNDVWEDELCERLCLQRRERY